MYLYKCYITPFYLCKSRFVDVPPAVLKSYVLDIQRITRAPWQALPSAPLRNLYALGFPGSVRDLQVEGQPALCLAALGNPDFDNVLPEIHRSADSGGPLCSPETGLESK